jgi:hypothetical protein
MRGTEGSDRFDRGSGSSRTFDEGDFFRGERMELVNELVDVAVSFREGVLERGALGVNVWLRKLGSLFP